MIKDETLDYLGSLHGGDWSTDEKREKLYDLVVQCSKEFPAPLLSVEIGCFAGVSAFCMGNAHKDLQNGFVVTIDSWDNITPLEGTNNPANNEWWKNLDIKSVFNAFLKSKERPEWSGYVNYLHGRSDSFADKFEDGSITLFHQDGNHNVETITRELELWSPKMKVGGYWVVDDSNWLEAKDGYAKLPSFGFELVEDFETWQVWKKTGNVKVFSSTDGTITMSVEDAEVIKHMAGGEEASEPPAGSFAEMTIRAQKEKEVVSPKVDKPAIRHKAFEEGWPKRGMQIGNYNIKPIALYLSDDEKWLAQYEHAKKYFSEQGVEDIYWLNGVHARAWGIKGTHIYLLDNKPEEKFYVGDANCGNFISQAMAYRVMEFGDYSHYLYLEGDCEFVEGWKEKLELALEDIPADFDMLYVGSCCAREKSPVLVSERSNLYHFPNRGGENYWHYYPLATHCYIIAKKAVQTMIETQRDCANPTDIAIARYALGSMKVFGILPRLANQFNTNLTP